jgi:hypothetical protein
MNEHTTISGKKKPASVEDLIAAIFVFGATPVMPNPFCAAAVVPAVCVPWPLRSSHAAGLGFGAPDSQDALLEKSMFWTRSGWSLSTPVSMMPVITAGLPPVTACARGVSICRMSHWSGNSGSWPAGAFGSSGGCSSWLAASTGCSRAP